MSSLLQAARSGLATRLTSDRLRETLFNVLAPRIEGAAFLWICMRDQARSGSRREPRRETCRVQGRRAPAGAEGAAGESRKIWREDGFSIQAGEEGSDRRRSRVSNRFDIAFLDPPYDAKEEAGDAGAVLGKIAEGAIGLMAHCRDC